MDNLPTVGNKRGDEQMEEHKGQLIEASPQVALDIMPLPDINRMVARKKAIDSLTKEIMKDTIHFGKIPGCGKKPALLKPGAEALCVAFNCRPKPVTTHTLLENGHKEYHTTCRLIYIPTGQVVGEASATCTTMESKYRFRTGPKESTGMPVPKEYWNLRKTNPKKALELLGGAGYLPQKEDGGKWYIWEKADGLENPNIADTYNTVERISEKRALVAATLITFGVSDKFTQEPETQEAPNSGTTEAEPAPKGKPASEGKAPTKKQIHLTDKQVHLTDLLNQKFRESSKNVGPWLKRFGSENVADIVENELDLAIAAITALIDNQSNLFEGDNA